MYKLLKINGYITFFDLLNMLEDMGVKPFLHAKELIIYQIMEKDINTSMLVQDNKGKMNVIEFKFISDNTINLYNRLVIVYKVSLYHVTKEVF